MHYSLDASGCKDWEQAFVTGHDAVHPREPMHCPLNASGRMGWEQSLVADEEAVQPDWETWRLKQLWQSNPKSQTDLMLYSSLGVALLRVWLLLRRGSTL